MTSKSSANRDSYAFLYKRKAWRDLREWRLKHEPFCRYCRMVGQMTPACIVDHIKPHRGDQRLFFSRKNTQSMCKVCHDSHKQRQERGKLGCDENGNPIDSAWW